jgi:hypothetical protein
MQYGHGFDGIVIQGDSINRVWHNLKHTPIQNGVFIYEI